MEFDGTLHIDVQKRNLLLLLNGRNLRLRRSVEVCVNLTVFDELLFGNHLLEFLLSDKVVVDSILFARSRRSRRVRDTEAETFSEAVLREVFDQSAFADA